MSRPFRSFSRIVIAVFLLLAACSNARVRPSPDPRVQAEPSKVLMNQRRLEGLLASRGAGTGGPGEYRIGPGDRLKIDVFRVQGFDGVYTVDRDGTIVMPLIDEVQAGGLTVEGLAKEISSGLERNYLETPEVRVSVSTFRGQPVAVLGAVVKPGFYAIENPTTTLLEVINQAGGLMHQTATRLYISPANGAPERRILPITDAAALVDPIEVDLVALSQGGLVRAFDLPVRGGDVVFVESAGQVVVEGWVKMPRPVRIRPGLSLAQAISEAGGLHFGASRRVVLSRRGRGSPGGTLTFDYDELSSGARRDIRLLDGDRIHVPANPVKVSAWAVGGFITGVVNIAIGGRIGIF